MSGLGKRWEAYRPSKTVWFWSCVACVVATIVIGFFWGGWVTGGTATQMASDAAAQARTELAASICVSRFEANPQAASQFAALKQTDSFSREDLLVKDGWATMPGAKQPIDGVPDLCVQQLMHAGLSTTAASTSG